MPTNNPNEINEIIKPKVKEDLSKFLNKGIGVIYNPIKDVYYDESIKKKKYISLCWKSQ